MIDSIARAIAWIAFAVMFVVYAKAGGRFGIAFFALMLTFGALIFTMWITGVRVKGEDDV